MKKYASAIVITTLILWPILVAGMIVYKTMNNRCFDDLKYVTYEKDRKTEVIHDHCTSEIKYYYKNGTRKTSYSYDSKNARRSISINYDSTKEFHDYVESYSYINTHKQILRKQNIYYENGQLQTQKIVKQTLSNPYYFAIVDYYPNGRLARRQEWNYEPNFNNGMPDYDISYDEAGKLIYYHKTIKVQKYYKGRKLVRESISRNNMGATKRQLYDDKKEELIYETIYKDYKLVSKFDKTISPKIESKIDYEEARSIWNSFIY